MTRFCGDCGEALAGRESFCPGCGTRLPDGAGLESLRAALEAQRPAPDALAAFDLGHRLLAAGEPEAAGDAFRLAVAADPALAPAHLALAVVHLQGGDAETARAHLVAAVEQSGDPALTASARAYLAMVLLDAFDLAGAEAELAQAEQEDPQNFLVLWKRGEYYYRLGRYPDAVPVLRAASRLRAPSKNSAAFVAQLLAQSQQKAQRSFTRQPLLPQWGAALRRRFAPAAGPGDRLLTPGR